LSWCDSSSCGAVRKVRELVPLVANDDVKSAEAFESAVVEALRYDSKSNSLSSSVAACSSCSRVCHEWLQVFRPCAFTCMYTRTATHTSNTTRTYGHKREHTCCRNCVRNCRCSTCALFSTVRLLVSFAISSARRARRTLPSVQSLQASSRERLTLRSEILIKVLREDARDV
jgi:hypothetical protein